MAPGLFPGIAGLTALLGVAEKGYLSLELRVDGEGGHSAMPPRHSNIGILAEAIRRLEEHPFPLRLTPVVESQFDCLGPEMPFKSRLVLANLWLFKGLFLHIFRFTAVRVESPADSARWHGTNERVLVKEYAKSIGFFQLLIKRIEMP